MCALVLTATAVYLHQGAQQARRPTVMKFQMLPLLDLASLTPPDQAGTRYPSPQEGFKAGCPCVGLLSHPFLSL